MIALRKVAEDADSITLEWDAVAGATGYRFSSNLTSKRSHTWDGARTRVKFAKGGEWYKVEALGVSDSGQFPAVAPPPPPPPPPPVGAIPAYADVGAKGTLTDHPGGQLSGAYSNRRFTGQVSFGTQDVNCANCEFAGGIASTYPGHGKVTLVRCTNRRGWYFEDAGGVGGHVNVFLEHCLFENSPKQAIRPKGAGLIVATDCWFRSYGTPANGVHSEAMQTLFDAAGTFTRCAFSQNPVSNNTITAVVNVGEPSKGTFTDCCFGNYDPTSGKWSRGGGYYMIYAGGSSFIRPTIYSAAGAYSDAFYPPQPPKVLVDPVYIKG